MQPVRQLTKGSAIPMSTRMIPLALAVLALSPCAFAESYYLHPFKGDDDNAGNSQSAPWKTLKRMNKAQLEAGDKVLLAQGKKFWGSLVLRNVQGEEENPVIVSTWNADDSQDYANAIINARGSLVGVHIINSSHVRVENLTIDANGGKVTDWQRQMHQKLANSGTRSKTMLRIGVVVEADRPGTFEGVTLDSLTVRNVFFNEPGLERPASEVRTKTGTQEYGWGIRVYAARKGVIKDIRIANTIVSNVAHTGIMFNTRGGTIDGVNLENNRILKTGGPGMRISRVSNARVADNVIYKSGSNDDSRKWGRGSGMWTWGSKDIVIEYNAFIGAHGPADSAGFHIDFNCRNIIFQYNLSANNAGGFIEILGNNHNSAYRYNVSINDGHRVKGENGDWQEGKTFWLSGYAGKDNERHGPYNSYIYNNTIYVDESVAPKVAVAETAEGLLVANNIFHIVGNARLVKGDQYRPQKNGKPVEIPRTFFRNNLFLHKASWPAWAAIQDDSPTFGDAGFAEPGGLKLENYIPANATLVQDKGIEIPRIPEDSVGLITGLEVTHDIMGNPITGRPDMGAIEISRPEEKH